MFAARPAWGCCAMTVPIKQIALDLALAPTPTLAGYYPGDDAANAAALQCLRLWAENAVRSPVPIYLWGAVGCGKTHLLCAARAALEEQGARVGWLDAKGDVRALFDEDWDAVLFDGVNCYGPQRQHIAFNWFVNAVSPADGRARAVLAAGRLPPTDLPLREDLRTRLGWGHVFELHPLSDTACRAVLTQAARARGLALPGEVLDFVLARFARDLGSLMQLLEALDRYALQTRRAITIALVKDMLRDA
jgi:DnaA family protein